MECIKQTMETAGSRARASSEAVPASMMLIWGKVQWQPVGRNEKQERDGEGSRGRRATHCGAQDTLTPSFVHTLLTGRESSES